MSTLSGPTTAGALTSRVTIGTLGAVVLVLLAREAALTVTPSLSGTDPFATLPVLGSAVAGGAGAAVAYAVLVRITAYPERAFVLAAVGAYAVMLMPVLIIAPDLGVEGVGQAWLLVLHLAVAVPIAAAVVWPRG